MKKIVIFILFLFVSGYGLAQTTVTLQDQCNCEVLSGTDVSAPGDTTPTGADTGDIYVNTTTGTIYFWDGDSWELTATDDQQLQNFSFDSGTNVLSLQIEDGNTVSVDLSSLSNAGSDDQTISTDGTSGNIAIEDGNTLNLNVDDADADPTNEITTVTDNGDGTSTIADVNGGTVTVDNDGVDNVDDADNDPTNENQTVSAGAGISVNQTGNDFQVTNTAPDQTVTLADGGAGNVTIGGSYPNFTIDVVSLDDADSDPTNEITTVTDNGDGTSTIADVNGGTVTVDNDGVDNVDDADNDPTNEITTVTDNGDGTSTIADVNGGTVTVDNDGVDNVDDADNDPTNELQNAAQVSFDDTVAGLGQTDVQGAIEALAASNAADNDTDPTNELQDISTDGSAGDISITSGSNITLNVDDADADPTNEITTVTDNGDGTSTIADVNGGTVTVDNDGVDNVDDADNDPTNEITTVTDNGDGTSTIADVNGGTVTVDNDGVDNVDDADNDPTNEITTVTDNGDGTSTIADVNGGTVTVDNDGVDNVDDADNDPTNEIQNLNEVLADGNDGGGQAIANIADPTNAQDAATKNYVDNISVDDADADPTNEIQNLNEVLADGNDGGGQAIANIADPTNAQDAATKNYVDNISVDDADADPTNEIQNLNEVLADGNDGGGQAIANIADPTNAQDAATKNYVDNISVDDADADPTNEYNTAFTVTGGNLRITDGGGNLDVPLSSIDTDDQDLGIGAGGVANESVEVTITDGSSTIIDIRDADSDITNELSQVGAGTPAATGATASNVGETYVDTTTGQLYVWDGATWAQVGGNASPDADPDPTNEIQDLEDVIGEDPSAGNQAITNLADPTNAQDAATKNYVDNISVDDADADPTNEIQNLNEVLADGNDGGGQAITNIADPTNAQDAATKNYVDNISVDDADADPTNEYNTAFTVTGGNLRITDGGGNLDVPLSSLGTDDQNLSEVLTEGNDAGGSAITNLADPTNAQDAATKNYVDNISVDDADADPTNEIQNLNEVLADGNDGGGQAIANIADPTNAQDAATKNYVDNISVDDADADPTNEIQNLNEVLADGNDGGGQAIANIADPTNPQDAATKNYVDNISVDDADADPTNEYNTAFTVTGGNLRITDGGGNLDVPLSSLGTDDQNLSEVLTEGNDAGGTAITNLADPTNPQDAATKNYVDNISVDDADADPTNEIQNLNEVLADGNDGGGQAITNIADPTNPQDAATKNYVDNISVDDADADPANEIQDLEDVIGEDPSAGNQAITNLADPTNPQDAATKNYVDNISVDDADADPTNEYNTAFTVTGGNLRITDGGGNLDVPLSSIDTDDQDLGIGAGGVANESVEVTITDGSSTIIDIRDADSDITNELSQVGAGTPAATGATASNVGETYVDTTTGQLYVWDGAAWQQVGGNASPDADPDPTNEYNTAFTVTGGNLRITDGGGNLDVPLSSLGTDDQNLSEVLTEGNDAGSSAITNLADPTNAQDAATKNYVDNISVDDADADPTNEIQNLNEVLADGNDGGGQAIANIADPTNAQDAATKNYVDNISVDDADADPTNEIQNLNEVLADGNDGGGQAIANIADPTNAQDAATKNYVDNISVDDADADPTNEIQNLNEVLADGNDGGGQAIANIADPTNAQDAATKNYVDNISVDDADADPTNEIQNLNEVLADGNDGGGQAIANIADPTNAQDAATKNYVDNISVDDADADPTNEIQDLEDVIGEDPSAGNQAITNLADPTNPQDAATKNYVDNISVDDADADPTNEIQNLNEVLADGNDGGGQAIANIADPTNAQDVATKNYVDNISVDDADADPTNEIQDLEDVIGEDPSAGNQAITNLADPTNAQDAATKNYVDNISVDDADSDPTNEYNTAFTVTGGNLRITDGGGNLDVPLSSLGTDDQNLSEVLTEGNDAGGTAIANLADPTNAQDAATKNYVDNISVDDADADPTNEYNTAFTVTGGNLRITDGGGNLDVPLSSLGTDDQNLSEVLTEGNDAGGSAITNLADPTNAQDAATKNYVDNISVDDADADPTNEIQNLNEVLADGNDGGGQAIANIADPTNAQDAATKNYVDNISVDDADADPTNEYNTAFTVTGGNLRITDGGGNLDVPLSSLGTDDQNLSEVLTEGNDAGGTAITNLADPTNPQDAATKNYVDNISVDDADADPTNEIQNLNEVLADGNDGGGQAIANIADPTNAQDAATKNYVDNISVDDADADPTNEYNTAFTVTGGNLRITDGGGNLDVPLSSLGTDDQNLSEVLTEGNDAGGSAITNLADPTNPQDAATKNYVDNISVDDADADPTNEIQNLNEVLADGNDGGGQAIANIADPTNAQDAATKNYVDNISVDDADADPTNEIQNLNEVLADGNDGGGQAITNIADPTNAQDAATKNYVDSVADDDVSVTNTVAGNRIATISEPGTAAVDINETVTSLSQNTTTGVISYTDEDGGAPETANVVGAEADNMISVGSNGGAYLAAMPTIYATGKVNGNGTAAAIYQATVSRLNEGDYQITFSTALPNANYIIQLSTIDCGGDCPGNTSANYDDPGITYYNQTTTGFRVNIGDSDNGTTQKDDIDLEFMFTVITIPN